MTRAITLCAFLLWASPSWAQEEPPLPPDMKIKTVLPARPTPTKRPKVKREAIVLYSGQQVCGEIEERAHGDLLLARAKGPKVRLDARKIYRRDAVETCEAPLPDLDYTPRDGSLDWLMMGMGGSAGGAAGMVALATLSQFLVGGCFDFDPRCLTPEVIVGATAGTLLGSTLTVWLMGESFKRDTNIGATMMGGMAGVGLGVLATAASPRGLIWTIPVGAGAGATLGYLLRDAYTPKLVLLPVQGGAYATYGFEF